MAIHLIQLWCSIAAAFFVATTVGFTTIGNVARRRHYRGLSASTADVDTELSKLNLTPVLEGYVKGLRNVPDDKLRSQQLFFLASKCPPMDAALKVDANKVPGCLSTVHVHATRRDGGKIHFVGDSDAQMTKGLVAMLVNGLSGHTNEEIQRVQPGFITLAGIGSTLTPGRNNGFLNMMKVMKDKAQTLADEMAADAGSSSSSGGGGGSTTGAVGGGPIYRSVVTKLGMLKPTELVVEDESYKHAGHAGVAGQAGGETHFNVRIVAACFDGLSLVQVTHTCTHHTSRLPPWTTKRPSLMQPSPIPWAAAQDGVRAAGRGDGARRHPRAVHLRKNARGGGQQVIARPTPLSSNTFNT